MGLCASKESTHRDVIAPQGDYHQQIEQEFGAYLQLDNPHNINTRYTYLYEPQKEVFVGKGIKKTHAYTCKVDKASLDTKRKEFWETRVEGSMQTWNALKEACEADELDETIFTILKAAGVKLIDKTLQMSYDDNGYKYDIPIFVINDPNDYKIPDESNKEFDQKTLDIKIRSGKQDVDLSLNTNMLVSEVIEKFKQQGNREDFDVRL